MQTKSTTRQKPLYNNPLSFKQQSYHYSRRRSVQDPMYIDQKNMKSSCDLISKVGKNKRRGSQQFDQSRKQLINQCKNYSMGKSLLRSQIGNAQQQIFPDHNQIGKSVILKQTTSRKSFISEVQEKSLKNIVISQNLIKNNMLDRVEYSVNNFPVKVQDISHQKSQQCQVKYRSNNKGTKTKNLLRNFANYNHTYILYNDRAKKLIQKFIINKKLTTSEFQVSEVEQVKKNFEKFIRAKKMQNFEQYKISWTQNSVFHELYKLLTMKFYIQEAYTYIVNSKISNKDIHIEYLHQFIQGLQNPSQFTRFKK